jgi:hypothetical protein
VVRIVLALTVAGQRRIHTVFPNILSREALGLRGGRCSRGIAVFVYTLVAIGKLCAFKKLRRQGIYLHIQ